MLAFQLAATLRRNFLGLGAAMSAFWRRALPFTRKKIKLKASAWLKFVSWMSPGIRCLVKSLVLPFEVGKPFDFGAERESLRVLYRTGDFADIRVSRSTGRRRDWV